MKVIVTGGAGFIGSNFIFYMMKKHPDYDIICLDSLAYAGNLSTLKSVMDNPHFKFVKLDIRDRDGVYKLFEEDKPDVVVVDPPRKGCDGKLIDTILNIRPERIVYVSCDPATLARDVKVLGEKGYEVGKGRACDMFPQGGHVETVCLLSRKVPV